MKWSNGFYIMMTSYYIFTLIRHCIDTMMNLPLSCSSFLVLPPEVKVDTILPYHLDASTVKSLYSQTLDKIYNDHNVAVIVALLNFLYMKLVSTYYTV